MIGTIVGGLKVAWKLKHVRTTIGEVRDVFVALNAVIHTYQKAMADDDLTPAEVKRIMDKVAHLAQQGKEAEEALRKVF